ncbi:hypothetical protein [Terrimonas sp.]|uniref:hypothetical protein n=1 Tax=Terrimonas sp. TaxID=1914338 RepID=UPI0014028F63|nr:hypothetical protein [Terrimonas sp.]
MPKKNIILKSAKKSKDAVTRAKAKEAIAFVKKQGATKYKASSQVIISPTKAA